MFQKTIQSCQTEIGCSISVWQDCIAFILRPDFTTTVLEAQQVQDNGVLWGEFSWNYQTIPVWKIVVAFAPKQYDLKPANPPSLVVL
jgi:hypothetical protein